MLYIHLWLTVITLLCSPLQELCVPTSPTLRMARWFRYLVAMFPALWQNYSCNVNYTLFGNVSRECVSNSMEVVWTGEAPTCQRKLLLVNAHGWSALYTCRSCMFSLAKITLAIAVCLCLLTQAKNTVSTAQHTDSEPEGMYSLCARLHCFHRVLHL